MSIIKPNILTDAGLASSTVPETDYPAWAATTSYSVGTNVMRAVSGVHKNFQNLIAGIDATLPELAPTRWLDLGPTNRWAMFDSVVGTVTSVAGNLTVVLRPGAVGGAALLELTGKEVSFVMRDAPGGTVIYSKTIALDGTMISSFYDWFYEPYVQLTDVVATGFPTHFVSNELTITISAITPTATASCGVCHLGEIFNIGEAQKGASVGIISYSKKTVDAFGNVRVTKRANSKRISMALVTTKSDFNRNYRLLASLDSIACIFITTEALGYEPLIAYGFYKDFLIVVEYESTHLTNLEIEGLV